jgi:hypothetical protein
MWGEIPWPNIRSNFGGLSGLSSRNGLLESWVSGYNPS